MNILITGASKGIGAELVKQFAANSNNNIVALSRNQELLLQLKEYCQKEFNNIIHIYSIDFLSPNFSNQLLSILKKENYTFNIVVNNAGYLLNKPFIKHTQEEIENIFKINTYVPIQICQYVIEQNSSESCHIVNVGSMGGFQGSVKFPGLSIYSSSKSALANLTECLAEEYKETNIKINCLALGSVQTEMLNKAFPNYEAQFTSQQMANYIFNFSLEGGQFFNGKTIPVSKTTP
ncbi:MAG: SDR family NAD(P)-dependent oxidoreductase [Vicingaceae bacterium]|nr:SDR family NAD(P)-dependent oxidoreductase [Vicingaceae bacterium]